MSLIIVKRDCCNSLREARECANVELINIPENKKA